MIGVILFRLELVALLRRPTTWISLGLFLAPAVASTVLDLGQLVTVQRGSHVGLYLTLMLLAGPLAGVLVAGGQLTPARRRRLEVVWVRGIPALELAAVAIGPALVTTAVGVFSSLTVFKLLGSAETISAPELFGAAIPLVLPAVWIGVAGAVLLGILLGEVPSALLIVAGIFGSAIVLPQSIVFPTNLLGLGFYWEPAVGFGPDAPLITSHGLWILALAASVLALCPIALVMTDARAAGVRRAAFMVVLLPFLLLPSYTSFASAADQTVALTPWAAGQPRAEIRTESLSVDVDCSGEQIAGISAIRSRTNGVLQLALNPGLHVTSVIGGSHSVEWLQDPSGMLSVEGVEYGLLLAVSYAGTLIFHRDDYAPASPGFKPTTAVRLPIRAYLSPEVCFLMRGGDWYPRALGVGSGPDGSTIDQLELRIRGAGSVVVPKDGNSTLAMRSPMPCLFVAFGRPAAAESAIAPTTLTSGQLERWGGLRLKLIALQAYPPPNAVFLPLISETLRSPDGVCTPQSGESVGSNSQVAARVGSEQAANLWLQQALVLDPPPGARVLGQSSSQERQPRAMPNGRPGFLNALQSTVADTFETDFPELLALRIRAQTEPQLHETLGRRGVLGGPLINTAVLGLHEYQRLSGDQHLGTLLGELGQECGGANPSRDALSRVIGRHSIEEQAALRPLLELR